MLVKKIDFVVEYVCDIYIGFFVCGIGVFYMVLFFMLKIKYFFRIKNKE